MTELRDMSFTQVLNEYIADMRSQGRINSVNTERAYRAKLGKHGDDLGNANPRTATRQDVKTTLRRWNGNTQKHGHAILSSFYKWCMEEGLRPDSPVMQVRSPKARQAQVYKMTQDEVLTLLREADKEQRDRWMARLGVCAGLRAQELLGVQGRHFARPGWVWVSEGIGKGMKERWIPVIQDLDDVAEEIRAVVSTYEFVLAPKKWRGQTNGEKGFYEGFAHDRQLTYPALHKITVALGKRAGIAGRVTPHTLRHAFGDYVARTAGIRVAQALMGHARITTTQRYTNDLSLDELAQAVQGLSLDVGSRPG
jgi:site-specific recombinase XerD